MNKVWSLTWRWNFQENQFIFISFLTKHIIYILILILGDKVECPLLHSPMSTLLATVKLRDQHQGRQTHHQTTKTVTLLVICHYCQFQISISDLLCIFQNSTRCFTRIWFWKKEFKNTFTRFIWVSWKNFGRSWMIFKPGVHC